MLAPLLKIALLCGASVLFFDDPAPPPSPYGTCQGTYMQATGTLRCTPNHCAPGCAKMTVSTPFGDAKICVCNYIGPQPFCCTIALTESGAYTAFGQCGVSGCASGSLCSTFPGSVPDTVEARCLF